MYYEGYNMKKLSPWLHWLKKIRHTKGIFHAKMDTTKDRNGMDLTEAEERSLT